MRKRLAECSHEESLSVAKRLEKAVGSTAWGMEVKTVFFSFTQGPYL